MWPLPLESATNGMHPSRSSQMTSPRSRIEDDLVVNLAVEWLPYGGPPVEEIWVRFGLKGHKYWNRVLALVTVKARRGPLSSETVKQIQALALSRLHPSESSQATQGTSNTR